MDMIKSANVRFDYQSQTDEDSAVVQHTALADVTLAIQKGEFVAILGHNGSGKSTLAKHFNALLLPTAGTVWVDGLDTADAANTWHIRGHAGMVFQNPDNQIIATIVEEDVAFGCKNLGVPSADIRTRVDAALAAVHMTAYAEHPPHFLSGGQKQRVAIAGILAMHPQCIVLDEPTAMLDPIGRKEVLDTIMRLNREEHITLVLITHYMDEAVLADRVVVMDNTRIVMDDVPKNIFRQVAKLKALGLDVPQVTEVASELARMGIPMADDILTIDEMVGAVCKTMQTL